MKASYTDRSFEAEIQIRHGLLYDLIDTNDELVSGRDFPELLSRPCHGSRMIDDWRFHETPALGVVSPRTGAIAWIPLPLWFAKTAIRNAVYSTLRPSFEEWAAGSYRRVLTSKQFHQIARWSARYFQGEVEPESHPYCRHDDCPCGCAPCELASQEDLAEALPSQKFHGAPRQAA